jgi:hypothetical protein
MLLQLGVTYPVPTVPEPIIAPVAVDADTGMAEETAAPVIEEPTEVPGVLRHLQAGKFKGVADVRLRIVFQKQLAELAEQQAIARATEASETMVSNLAAEIRSFTNSAPAAEADNSETNAIPADTEAVEPSGVESALADFQEAVDAATGSLADGNGLDLTDYGAKLQAAFDTLASSLETVLTPAATGIDASLEVAIQAGDTTDLDLTVTADISGSDNYSTGVTEFLASLRDMFAQALGTLLESAETRDILPPLSEPRGNGQAFDKFKAIYDELNAVDANIDDPGIDVEA